jgi:hypothetical protein
MVLTVSDGNHIHERKSIILGSKLLPGILHSLPLSNISNPEAPLANSTKAALCSAAQRISFVLEQAGRWQCSGPARARRAAAAAWMAWRMQMALVQSPQPQPPAQSQQWLQMVLHRQLASRSCHH